MEGIAIKMRYTDYEKLTVIQLKNKYIDEVSFQTLAVLMLERPTNVIYCERDGKLYGIISTGDIARASEKGIDSVVINKNFTRISPGKYIDARKIFYEKEKINSLPVVNDDDVLLGEYARWEDSLTSYMLGRRHREWIHRHYRYIGLVRPCSGFKEKERRFLEFYREMVSLDLEVKVIIHREVIDYVNDAEEILFVDEDEQRATDTLFKYVLRRKFPREKLKTYMTFVKELGCECIGESGYRLVKEYLYDIRQKGVEILNLVFKWNTEYGRLLKEKLSKKLSAIGKDINPITIVTTYPDFFDDLYSEEYANSIIYLPVKVETGKYNGALKDCRHTHYNVTNGERHTIGQPEEYQKTVYFIGPCFMYGRFTEDKNTIESILQSYLNDRQRKIRIVNCGSIYDNKIELLLTRIKEMPLRKGDIVVIHIDNREFAGIPELDLLEVLEKHNVNINWMTDNPLHCNHKINAIYAESIYNKMESVLVDDIKGERIGNDEGDLIKTIYIDRYFKKFDGSKYEKIGSIVMNCNPFTYGHRYLIEQASAAVDFLIIFVVEENKSLFTFHERFAMVCEATAWMENVMVVPSGPFILSQTTFPEYFIKAADKELVENAENDVIRFAEKVASCLNIKYRFVGEEPEDKVTNEYNLVMKRIFPKYGIEVIEIPRKKVCDRYISASLVRKCLEDWDVERVSELVPESTMRILFEENN